MAISINHSTYVISVLQSDLSLVSGILYELDVNAFRLALKDLEDDDDGMSLPDTHDHGVEKVLSGITYARSFEIINGFTVTFENTGSPYTVRCIGANHNIADVTNYTSNVSIIIGNSAGLISVTSGSGLDAGQAAELTAIKAKTDSLTFTTPGEVDSNVQSVNDVPVTGDGQAGTEWGP